MDKGHTQQAFNAYLKLHEIATFTDRYVRSKVSSVPVFKRTVNIVRTHNFHFFCKKLSDFIYGLFCISKWVLWFCIFAYLNVNCLHFRLTKCNPRFSLSPLSLIVRVILLHSAFRVRRPPTVWCFTGFSTLQ